MMKKIIVLLVSLFCLISPAFAGNLLQQQDELKFVQKMSNNPMPTQYGKDYLIREDYYGYFNGKESTYGLILYYIDEAKKSKNISDLKYLNLAKSKIEIIAKLQNNDTDRNMRADAVNKKIIIEDSDYKKLSKDIKEIITMINFFFE